MVHRLNTWSQMMSSFEEVLDILGSSVQVTTGLCLGAPRFFWGVCVVYVTLLFSMLPDYHVTIAFTSFIPVAMVFSLFQA